MSHPQPNPQVVLIDIAENAVRSWAGPVDRTEALRVLRKWRFYPGLSNVDRLAILARFPEVLTGVSGNQYELGDLIGGTLITKTEVDEYAWGEVR